MAKNRPVVAQRITPDKKDPAYKAAEPVAVAEDGIPAGVIAAGIADESLSSTITDDGDSPSEEEAIAESLLPQVDLATGPTVAADGSPTPTPDFNDIAAASAATDLRTFDLEDQPGDNEFDSGLMLGRPSRDDLGTPDFGLGSGGGQEGAQEGGAGGGGIPPREDLGTAFGSQESLIGDITADDVIGTAKTLGYIMEDIAVGTASSIAADLRAVKRFVTPEPPPPSPPGEPDTGQSPPKEPETGQSSEPETGQSTVAESDRAQRADEAAKIQREQDAAKKAEQDAKKAEEAEKAQALEDEEAAKEAEQAAAKKAEADAAAPPEPSQPDEEDAPPTPEEIEAIEGIYAQLGRTRGDTSTGDASKPVEGGDDAAFGAGVGTGIPTGVLAQGKESLIGQPNNERDTGDGVVGAGHSLSDEIQFGEDGPNQNQSDGPVKDLFPEDDGPLVERRSTQSDDTEDTDDTGADPLRTVFDDPAVEDPTEGVREALID